MVFRFPLFILFVCVFTLNAEPIELKKDDRIVLLGGGLGARMEHYNLFDTELHLRNPKKQLFIRNMCDEGNTPGFRPHSARSNPWAFPGAEKFHKLEAGKDRWGSGHVGNGFYRTSDEWLKFLKPNIIIAFFGFSESFAGEAGLESFKGELSGFVKHTKRMAYNGKEPAKLVLVSPIAFEDRSEKLGTPNGIQENTNIAMYTSIMEEVATEHKVKFVNVFAETSKWFNHKYSTQYTRDGALLNWTGYRRFTPYLINQIFGEQETINKFRHSLEDAVREKNWLWLNYYKIPNGVHVFGRRHRPYGPQNYPSELKKLEQMLEHRDKHIWERANGQNYDLITADKKTLKLPSYGKRNTKYVQADEAVKHIQVPKGYKIELFASETRFPDLANPVQCSFDNKGRLWVATMPSYPHYQPGDPKPNDKLLIFEDTNKDGRADRQIVFAENLHLPMGFELTHNGVYVAQGYSLIFLKDEDRNDRIEHREVIMSGFDDHDTHHAISAFCADPSGAILMGEGTFLHSHIETAYGTIRSSNGGFFRYDPSRRKLERTARLSIPNPWGIAFDKWGQDFFLDTSDPSMRWMLPGSIKVGYGKFAVNPKNLLSVRVRPTSGLEFVSSRHFPDEVQGDILLNNVIGFQGTKQHSIKDDGTGYKSSFRQDLTKSKDRNYRPVDMEFAPDGSLYIVDWHNARIGHMQHNARDPNRDHSHGRIYRVTYPSRPLVEPAEIAYARISKLLDNLKLPEYRTRYRTRRELRGHKPDHVAGEVKTWVSKLDKTDKNYEHHLLEALWVTWGVNRIDEPLLYKLLSAKDYRVRAATVRALRYNRHRIKDQKKLLLQAAKDPHGRVRLEAIAASSWQDDSKTGLNILNTALKTAEKHGGVDGWTKPVSDTVSAYLNGQALKVDTAPQYQTHLKGKALKIFKRGAEVFNRDGHCITCHQADGKGLPAAGFPPLKNSKWVSGDPVRLIKLVQHGLIGPLEVDGKKFPGTVPMTPFKMLSDQEMADVLSFVRNTFDNKASLISSKLVRKVRDDTKDKSGLYKVDELLKEHPFK